MYKDIYYSIMIAKKLDTTWKFIGKEMIERITV